MKPMQIVWIEEELRTYAYSIHSHRASTCLENRTCYELYNAALYQRTTTEHISGQVCVYYELIRQCDFCYQSYHVGKSRKSLIAVDYTVWTSRFESKKSSCFFFRNLRVGNRVIAVVAVFSRKTKDVTSRYTAWRKSRIKSHSVRWYQQGSWFLIDKPRKYQMLTAAWLEFPAGKKVQDSKGELKKKLNKEANWSEL